MKTLGSNVWSSFIQGPLYLETSRELRFPEERKDFFLNLFGFRPGMKIADIGCGPGTLTIKLARWLGESSFVVGVDSDSNFIARARTKSAAEGLKNIEFVEGDAMALPFNSASLDACFSCAVIEHIPDAYSFIKEQRRVCRMGGAVVILTTLYHPAPLHARGIQADEYKLWLPIFKARNALDEVRIFQSGGIAFNHLSKLLAEVGLTDINSQIIKVPLIPSAYRNDQALLGKLLEDQRSVALEELEMGLRLCGASLSLGHAMKLRALVNKRFDRLSYADWSSCFDEYVEIGVVRGEV